MNIQKVAIVGAGLMGHGIAQEFACAGYEVYLHDLTQKTLEQAMSNIKENLQMLIKAGLMTQERMELGLKQIYPGTQLKDIVTDVDLVIESVFENLEIKQTVFQELDKFCPEHTIFASNTSTLMPSQLASATQRPSRVLVTHYFNPPYLLPLVEVVRSSETSDNTITTIIDLSIVQ